MEPCALSLFLSRELYQQQPFVTLTLTWTLAFKALGAHTRHLPEPNNRLLPSNFSYSSLYIFFFYIFNNSRPGIPLPRNPRPYTWFLSSSLIFFSNLISDTLTHALHKQTTSWLEWNHLRFRDTTIHERKGLPGWNSSPCPNRCRNERELSQQDRTPDDVTILAEDDDHRVSSSSRSSDEWWWSLYDSRFGSRSCSSAISEIWNINQKTKAKY